MTLFIVQEDASTASSLDEYDNLFDDQNNMAAVQQRESFSAHKLPIGVDDYKEAPVPYTGGPDSLDFEGKALIENLSTT